MAVLADTWLTWRSKTMPVEWSGGCHLPKSGCAYIFRVSRSWKRFSGWLSNLGPDLQEKHCQFCPNSGPGHHPYRTFGWIVWVWPSLQSCVLWIWRKFTGVNCGSMECVCCYRPRGLCIIKVRAVHISGTKSGMFSVDVGLHQGWTLSLILFVIFIDSWGGSGIKLRCFMGCSLWRFSNHARLGRDLRVGPEHLTLLESLVAFLKWCQIWCICQFRVEDVGCINERQILSVKACLDNWPL